MESQTSYLCKINKIFQFQHNQTSNVISFLKTIVDRFISFCRSHTLFNVNSKKPNAVEKKSLSFRKKCIYVEHMRKINVEKLASGHEQEIEILIIIDEFNLQQKSPKNVIHVHISIDYFVQRKLHFLNLIVMGFFSPKLSGRKL